MRLPSFLLVIAAAALVATILTVWSCGGGSGTNPTPVSSSTPTPGPSPTPTQSSGLPPGMICSPTPPPLYGIKVKVLFDSGSLRKTLDSRPVVINVDGYCEKAVGVSGKFCFTRQEDDPQATACDYMAVGRAADTGRWGPTWYYESQLCVAQPGQIGCSNHPDNQFLVNVRGDGTYEACAAPEIPLSQDPDHFGSRCGRCTITNSGDCQ